MGNSRALYQDIGWYGLSKFAPGLAGLAAVSLLVRALDSAQYGSYALACTAANASSVIASAWLAQGIHRFLPMAKEHDGVPSAVRALAKAALAISLVVSLTAICVGAPGFGFATLVLSAILSTAQSGHTISCAILMARFRASAVAALEAGRSVLAVIFVLPILVWTSYGFLPAVAALGLSYLLSFTVGAALARRQLNRLSIGQENEPSAKKAAMWRLARYGVPMSVWLAAFTLLPFLDRMLISLYYGRAATGLYAAYYDFIVRGSGFFIMPVVLAVQPRAMTLFGLSRFEDMRNLLKKALFATLSTTAAISVGTFLLGPWVTSHALGLPGDADRLFLACLALGGCLWQVGLLTHKVLEAEGKTTTLIISMLSACGLAVGVNVLELPRLGMRAAGYALVAGSVAYALLTGVIAHRLLKFRLIGNGLIETSDRTGS